MRNSELPPKVCTWGPVGSSQPDSVIRIPPPPHHHHQPQHCNRISRVRLVKLVDVGSSIYTMIKPVKLTGGRHWLPLRIMIMGVHRRTVCSGYFIIETPQMYCMYTYIYIVCICVTGKSWHWPEKWIVKTGFRWSGQGVVDHFVVPGPKRKGQMCSDSWETSGCPERSKGTSQTGGMSNPLYRGLWWGPVPRGRDHIDLCFLICSMIYEDLRVDQTRLCSRAWRHSVHVFLPDPCGSCVFVLPPAICPRCSVSFCRARTECGHMHLCQPVSVSWTQEDIAAHYGLLRPHSLPFEVVLMNKAEPECEAKTGSFTQQSPDKPAS